MFYTVFSTNNTPYMQWQSELLEYSWKRVEQEGVLIRLVATDNQHDLPAQKHAHCVPTRLWNTHPETGDFYPVYNKPASLLEWVFRDKPEGTVLLLDPDCVFRAPVTQRVAPGSPASQAWIDLSTCAPGPQNPFGLGADFSFLADHCSRLDSRTVPVMIPTLIHTSDLRKICARWLDLCGVVRQNFRNSKDLPAWESDMFSYLAACAEYDLQHTPISLGICTNWPPESVPDAPIIHYCQPILDKNGTEIFFKQTYTPWNRIDTQLEPRHDYGRDLVNIVNAFVDETDGTIRPASLDTVPRWSEDVKEGRVIDDMLLEHSMNDQGIWLNSSGKAIWELCDGSRSVDQIGSELSSRFGIDKHELIAQVQSTVGQLLENGSLRS